MNRTRRLGLIGGLVAVAAVPFALLWVVSAATANDPLTFRLGLGMAIGLTVLGTPAMVAAWLLWRAWWRRAGDDLAALDGPGWLLAAATATLPADRRDWGQAMAAELAQVPGGAARWRFAAGCARAAVLPPGGSRAVDPASGRAGRGRRELAGAPPPQPPAGQSGRRTLNADKHPPARLAAEP